MKKLLLTLIAMGMTGTAIAKDDVQDFILLTHTRPVLVRAQVMVDDKPYLEVWNALVDRVLNLLDGDKDGVLSKEEMERMPPVQLITGSVTPAFGRSAKTSTGGLDANNDGKATRDELAAWLRKHGAAPFQFHIGPVSIGPPGVRIINVGEAPTISAEVLNNAIFGLLDTDKDSRLTAKELAAAPTVFATKDADDDEMITPREIAPPSSNTSSRNSIKDDVITIQVPQDAPTTDSLVFMINPGDSGSAIARKLIATYAPKDQPKRKLSMTDLGLDKDTFARLDADKDGGLDSEELAKFTRRPADVELTIRLGGSEEGRNSLEATSRVADIKVEKTDQGARLEVGVTRVELGAGNPPSKANFNFNFRLRDQYVNQFKTADTDNNNYLDEKEAMSNPLFSGIFRTLDTDRDGMLYEKEMVTYLDKLEDLQKSVRDGCVTMSLTDKGSGLFEQLDRDRDGRLSVRELRHAPELVQMLDGNSDGTLARTEVPRNFEVRVRRGTAGTSDGTNVVVVARATFSNLTNQPKPKDGPKWFQKMDTNRDGDLSRREFLGTDADFARIDKDGDRLISAAEAAAYKK